jgi:hypothetical protein
MMISAQSVPELGSSWQWVVAVVILALIAWAKDYVDKQRLEKREERDKKRLADKDAEDKRRLAEKDLADAARARVIKDAADTVATTLVQATAEQNRQLDKIEEKTDKATQISDTVHDVIGSHSIAMDTLVVELRKRIAVLVEQSTTLTKQVAELKQVAATTAVRDAKRGTNEES